MDFDDTEHEWFEAGERLAEESEERDDEALCPLLSTACVVGLGLV